MNILRFGHILGEAIHESLGEDRMSLPPKIVIWENLRNQSQPWWVSSYSAMVSSHSIQADWFSYFSGNCSVRIWIWGDICWLQQINSTVHTTISDNTGLNGNPAAVICHLTDRPQPPPVSTEQQVLVKYATWGAKDMSQPFYSSRSVQSRNWRLP